MYIVANDCRKYMNDKTKIILKDFTSTNFT